MPPAGDGDVDVTLKLSEVEISVLVNVALDELVFTADWEFATVFGISRSELIEIKTDLANGNSVDQNTLTFLRNTISTNLLGYPHQSGAYILARYGLSL